jgi:hypothetical protein
VPFRLTTPRLVRTIVVRFGSTIASPDLAPSDVSPRPRVLKRRVEPKQKRQGSFSITSNCLGVLGVLCVLGGRSLDLLGRSITHLDHPDRGGALSLVETALQPPRVV